jgi:hypothetical protein
VPELTLDEIGDVLDGMYRDYDEMLWEKHTCAPYVERSTKGHPQREPWDGPPADEVIRRALQQPGARRRHDGGVKFRCFGCRDGDDPEHRDRSCDNAKVFPDGRWACAVNPDHKHAIGVQLGVFDDTPLLSGLPELPRI